MLAETETERYEILALGESEVQVLESSVGVSTSFQLGKKTPDCIINAAVDEAQWSWLLSKSS